METWRVEGRVRRNVGEMGFQVTSICDDGEMISRASNKLSLVT
jgi:hypothetical protein